MNFDNKFEAIKEEHIGYDGLYAEDPVSLESIEFAKSFIKTIPDNFKIEEIDIGCDPDGSITIGWYVSKEQTLYMSFEKNNIIAYAYLILDESDSGNVIFNNEFPSIFHKIISKFKRK